MILPCTFFATESEAALELVKDGKATAVIVSATTRDQIPKPESPQRKGKPAAETDEALAVRVLVDWIRKISDVELPVTNSAPGSGTIIFVGKAAIAAGLKVDDIPSPSREAVRITADERRILIGGQSDAATLKAVCRFLETLGCRYFMDGSLGEVYPRSRNVSVGPLSITEKPGLLYRNPKGPSWFERLWKAWNGAGGETFHHKHSWGGYVKESLFDEHPEFFAMGADGQRKRGQWLCTSNKELRRYFAERVMVAIRSGTRNPSLSPADGRGYCQCAACKAQDDPNSIEPSSGTVSISNRYVDFFDDIARQVGAVYPDSVLSFYCYADYTQPPTTRRRLATNLCAVIAPIRYCRLHEIGHTGCPSREQQVAMIDGWATVAPRLGYYNYMYNLADGVLPFFKFTPCAKEFPLLKEKGLCEMTIEILSNWHVYGPQIYLSLRLAYDPGADANAIMEDYWQKFYGPRAGAFMKQYWMGIDAEAARLRSHAGSFFGLQQIYTPTFLSQCKERLDKAAEAARGDAAYEQRVALHAEGFRSAVEYQQISEAMERGDFTGARKTYDQMHARLRGLTTKGWVNPEYATAYLERFLSKTVDAGVAATAAPHKVLALPNRWRFSLDENNVGLERGWHTPAFDDSKWPLIATDGKTLDAQGFDKQTWLWYRTKFQVPAKHGSLGLFFGEVDGFSEVYINGQKIEVQSTTPRAKAKPSEGRGPSRAPFEVDVGESTRVGENLLVLRVDHAKLTDLSLGGILRPVLLIEK